MEIQKERKEFEREDFVKTIIHRYEWSEEFNKYKIKDTVINGNVSDLIDATDDIQILNGAFLGWLAKSQTTSEWKDYSQQSPRIDGRYQIFINGEQLAADWKSPFGFADPIEGVALIQELITHWAVLNADPVIEAQEQSHDE